MKLSINVKQIEKTIENLKLAINHLKIKAKEENFMTLDINNIIHLFCLFHVWTKASISFLG